MTLTIKRTATLAGVALLAVACGGGSGKPARAASDRASMLDYSRCMRAHGVPDFPDPNANGQLTLTASPGSGLDPDSPQMQAAMRACKRLLPSVSSQRSKADYGQALKFSQCMRAHGEPDFPDPQPPGSGPQTQKRSGGGHQGPDPDSPQFKSALQSCRHLAPSGANFSTHKVGGS